MATFRQLFENAIRVSPGRRNPPNSASRQITRVILYPTTNNMLIQFMHGGVTVQGIHAVNLMFFGLEVTKDDRSFDTHIKIPDGKGGFLFGLKPDLATTQVKVRCTCPDFYFTFGIWNYNSGSLFGKRPRPYIRKSINRAERNPLRLPGVCKHCLNSAFLMQTNRWTRMGGGV